MATTAKLLDAIKRNDGWKLDVEFSDGVDTVTRKLRFDGTTTPQLVYFIKRQANQIERIKSADFSVHIGKILDLSDPITPIPIPPTPEELAKISWFKDWRILNKMIHLINNGIILANDTRVVAMQTKLKNSFLDSYLADI